MVGEGLGESSQISSTLGESLLARGVKAPNTLGVEDKNLSSRSISDCDAGPSNTNLGVVKDKNSSSRSISDCDAGPSNTNPGVVEDKTPSSRPISDCDVGSNNMLDTEEK